MTLAPLTARPLDPAEVAGLIAALVTDAKLLPGITRVILFGSAAENRMTEASDLDAVLIFSTAEEARQAQKAFYVQRTFSWPVDAICVDVETFNERSRFGGVLYVAAREGRVVFERGE